MAAGAVVSAEAAAVAAQTVETTDPTAASQTTALACLPLVLPEAVPSTVYYQVVTPVTAVAAEAAPLTVTEGAEEAVLQQAVPQEQPQQLPVLTY